MQMISRRPSRSFVVLAVSGAESIEGRTIKTLMMKEYVLSRRDQDHEEHRLQPPRGCRRAKQLS